MTDTKKIADHIEQRLLTWQQQRMNKSGDRLALDDFMEKDSIDDLIDFVCDEYALDALVGQNHTAQHPHMVRPAPALLTHMQCVLLWGRRSDGPSTAEVVSFARAIESAVLRKNGWVGE